MWGCIRTDSPAMTTDIAAFEAPPRRFRVEVSGDAQPSLCENTNGLAAARPPCRRIPQISLSEITPVPSIQRILKRISNILKYGLGEAGRERKRADKERLRKEKFESERWKKDGDVVTRQYTSYDEYLEHQSAKLDQIEHRLRETEDEDFADFKDRFQGCKALSEARSVLCLGARLGTEVRALHALNHFAVGIDLNPGENNLYVLPGDFHHIAFPDGSVDAIYTNVMDHVFDLEKVMAEIKRLLRPGGLFVADLLQGFDEGFVPGEYEATHWRNTDEFVAKLRDMGGFGIEEDREIGQRRRDTWRQVVFRKAAA